MSLVNGEAVKLLWSYLAQCGHGLLNLLAQFAAHDALSALINLCADPMFVTVMDSDEFLYNLILMIVVRTTTR